VGVLTNMPSLNRTLTHTACDESGGRT
jgi:hypothetical protein